jgi:pimeloyl-ACP methyl ester carboxylesterase
MQTLTVKNAQTYVIDKGQGETIVFLHGVPDTSEMWQPFIQALSGDYRVIAPDLPGHGRSELPPGFDFSLDSMAQWVDDVLTAAGVQWPITLVVHDFGGHYGLAWAVKHPERVARLVISNTNFFSDYSWHISAKIWRTPLLGELSMKSISEGMYVKAVRKAAPLLTEDYARSMYEHGMRQPAQRQHVLKLYRASDSARFKGWEDKLRELTARIPTLVLWGDADPFASPTVADKFGGQVVHYPQFSHWVPVEGGDVVIGRVKEFLK